MPHIHPIEKFYVGLRRVLIFAAKRSAKRNSSAITIRLTLTPQNAAGRCGLALNPSHPGKNRITFNRNQGGPAEFVRARKRFEG
jgi:hypothetical protein